MRALAEDMYHTFLDAKISVQLFSFLVLYVVLFWLYAFIYLFISVSAANPAKTLSDVQLPEATRGDSLSRNKTVL